MNDIERLLDRCVKVQQGLTHATTELTSARTIVDTVNDHDAHAASKPSVEALARRDQTQSWLDLQRGLHGALRAVGTVEGTVSTMAQAVIDLPDHATLDHILGLLNANLATAKGLREEMKGLQGHMGSMTSANTLLRLQGTRTGRDVQTHILAGKTLLDDVGKDAVNLDDQLARQAGETDTDEGQVREEERQAAEEGHRALTTWDDLVALAESIRTLLDYASTVIGVAHERTEAQRTRAGRLGYRKVAEGWDSTSVDIVQANADVGIAHKAAEKFLGALEQARGLPSIDDIAAVLRAAGVANISSQLTSARQATVKARESIPLGEPARLSSVIEFKLRQAARATETAESSHARFMADDMALLVRLVRM